MESTKLQTVVTQVAHWERGLMVDFAVLDNLHNRRTDTLLTYLCNFRFTRLMKIVNWRITLVLPFAFMFDHLNVSLRKINQALSSEFFLFCLNTKNVLRSNGREPFSFRDLAFSFVKGKPFSLTPPIKTKRMMGAQWHSLPFYFHFSRLLQIAQIRF